jgi:hypothetical protein
LFGFLLVIIFAAGAGVVYYKTKLATTATPTPSPSASSVIVEADPSSEPASTSSASPKASAKSSGSPRASARSSATPVSTARASSTPTPTPTPVISRDIRFGNPSANIKQTIDENNGDGRVINREYTSIQAGQFDEVPSAWSPRVTICYHIVSNEEMPGKDLKYTFTLDGKVEAEGNFGQYDKLEPGRLYDLCRDATSSIGKHVAKLQINGDKSVKELNYTNGLATAEWENLSDRIAPNFSLGGPYDWDDKGTCFLILSPSDNVTPLSGLKVEQKIDGGSYATTNAAEYCFKGDADSSHSYAVKITDGRGNTNEQTKNFVLY